MAKLKKEEIEITDIGDAVNHITVGINYLNKRFPKASKVIYSLILIGLSAGVYYVATMKRLDIKELTPLTVSNSPFTLYADEKDMFRLDSATGKIYFAGKERGVWDKQVEIYKFVGQDIIIIHDRKSGRTFQMGLDLK